MKKYKLVYIIIIVLIIFSLIAFCLTKCDYDFMFHFVMYDHIQYNGIDYYHAEDQNHPSGYSNEDLPVYLVDNKSQVHYKYVYCAYGYKGDDEHIYLFFDGAVYTREESLMSEYSRDKLEKNTKFLDKENSIAQ